MFSIKTPMQQAMSPLPWHYSCCPKLCHLSTMLCTSICPQNVKAFWPAKSRKFWNFSWLYAVAHGCTSVVRPLRIHAEHRIPIDVAKPIAADEVWSVCVCVCVCVRVRVRVRVRVCVYWTQLWALRKWLDRSRCCLDYGFEWAQGTIIISGRHLDPAGEGAILDGHFLAQFL